MASLLNAALSVLRLCDLFPSQLPLRAKADELNARPELALKLIGALK